MLPLRIDKEETTINEKKKKKKKLVQRLSATRFGLLLHACLLALSYSGRHERTTVSTLLLCTGQIEVYSLVLAVRGYCVAFGAWFVPSWCAQKKSRFKKQKLCGCLCSCIKYLDLFSERARLAPPWPLRSSQLNTASVYYLLDLSNFSLLSLLFLYYSVVLPFSHFFRFFVSSFLLFRLCLYVKPAANN